MSTIFGDFVFKITAPIENAIKNLQKWDKTQQEVEDNSKKIAKEETNLLNNKSKSWKSFLGTAKTMFTAFSASVMKWSPHIQAHLSIIGINMKMLAMDLGKTWGPAFKLASDALSQFSKWWRDLGKEDSGVLANAAHEAGNIGMGLFAAWGAVKLMSSAGNFLFGAAGSAATMATESGTVATNLNPFLGGVLIGLTGFFLTKALGGEDDQAYLAGIIGMGAWVLGGATAIPITLAVVGATVAQNKIEDFLDNRRQELQDIAGEDGPTVHYGMKEWFEDASGKTWEGLTREEKIRQDAFKKEIYENLEDNKLINTVVWGEPEKQTSSAQRLWDDIRGIFTTTQDEINRDKLIKLEEQYDITDKEGKKINRLVEDLVHNDYTSYNKASIDTQNTVAKLYDELQKINKEEKDNQIKNGENLVTNFEQGMENKKGLLTETWRSFIDMFRLDFLTNDDSAKNLKNIFDLQNPSQSQSNQNIQSNLIINNTNSSGAIDAYSLATIAKNVINRQYSSFKGLGTQYN